MQKVVLFPVGLLLTPDKKHWDSAFLGQIKTLGSGHFFAAVSDRPEPPWFKKHADMVNFCYAPSFGGSRKSGKFVAGLLDLNKAENLQKSQIVVLGYGEADVPMYANSQSVLVRCDWRSDLHPKIRPYGIPCPTVGSLPAILNLLNEEHPWYFTHSDKVYDTYCLTNAATRVGSDEELKALAAQLQSCLKAGNPKKRQEFIVHLLSSFYATDIFRSADTWAYYPSSSSSNDGSESICSFVELARTTFNRRKKPHPLLIRHTATAARHMSAQANREDPALQIQSIHLHPDYEGHLRGKTVVVLDDYMTTGVSFSVAAAFLRKAGAAKVVAVAMGKFPRTSYVQEIDLATNPFAPVRKYHVLRKTRQDGTLAPEASQAFKRKFV